MKIGEYLIQAIRRTGTRHVFGIPAALSVQLAAPARRPLVLTGDGSFQMFGLGPETAHPASAPSPRP